MKNQYKTLRMNTASLIPYAKNSRTHSEIQVGQIAASIKEWGFTNPVIIDVFGGSGSTLIACEKTNRHCRMMELDQKYCDVIIKRWQEFTGKEALLETDGRTFAEVTIERLPHEPQN